MKLIDRSHLTDPACFLVNAEKYLQYTSGLIYRSKQLAIEGAEKSGERFDLILMDMQMPVMNGREAVTEIRGLGVEVPIIALTADAMEGERFQIRSTGSS